MKHNNSNISDQEWLDLAYDLVWAGVGKTTPNPAVAAIIVKDNKIIAQGVHIKAGSPHAEQLALKACHEDLTMATMYVTLEPCAHTGKTPACTELIYKSGLKKVVYGCKDKNKNVVGNGAEILQQKGVNCQLLKHLQCEILYADFFNAVNHEHAAISLKIAIDSKSNIADENGNSLPITSDSMHARVAHWRAFHDAIITSDNCIYNDNPRLNARLPNVNESKPLIILATSDKFSIEQNIFNTCSQIYLFIPHGIELRDKAVESRVIVSYYEGSEMPWDLLLKQLANLGFSRVWAEFGAKTTRRLIAQQIATDVLVLQGIKEFASSSYNLRGVNWPNYNYNFIREMPNSEQIFVYANSKFAELYIDKERICLPE